jgi:hypothetical protein
LGEASDASYHQLAQRMEHDLRRFYG